MDANRLRVLAGLPLMEAKKPKKTYTFTKISYDQFERLGAGSDDYEETEIDEKSVIAVYEGKRCIGLWYVKAKIGTKCPTFDHDVVSYAEQDPNWPYGD